MNDVATRLLDELKLLAKGRKRLDYAEVCTAFGKLFPAVTGLEQRRRLHSLMNSLAEAGTISLPAGRAHYDRSAEPHIPRWLQLAITRASSPCLPFNVADFPWMPELRFAAEIRNLQQLDVLRRVHEFLAAGGAGRCIVPVKERSVEMFSDEKKLDELRSGALFRTGKLSLELLRCFQVSPPLVWERGPSALPRPVLVIENHSTWHSFVRWNKDNGAWAAICYGSGDCFETSAPSIGDVVGQVPWDGRIQYFGDLDPKGLRIPVRASQALAIAGLPPVTPQMDCYALVLARASSVGLPAGDRLEIPGEANEWLDSETSAAVASWFAKGVRIPQELVGYELLIQGRLSWAGEVEI